MTYSIALIGCGRVGYLLEDDPLRVKPATHMGGIKKIIDEVEPGFTLELKAVCDIDKERLDSCRKRFAVPTSYTDYKRLILNEKPDIAVIASWTSTHHEIAVFAARNGVKGIVLEKPLAANLRQARHIIDVCRKYGVKLVINHERRWAPLYLKTKEIVESDTLGRLKFIYGNVLSRSAPYGNWKELLDTVGGGPLFHDGTHLVDIIRFFAGEVLTLHGNVSRDNPEIATETTATAMMQTESGVQVFLEAGGMREYFNFELDLHLERGRIRIGNSLNEYFEVEASTLYSGFADLTRKEFPFYSYNSDPFTGALLECIRAIEENREPFSSGEDGLKALEIIFGIYQSAAHDGRLIHFPLKLRGHPLKKLFSKTDRVNT